MRGISAHSNGFQTCRALHLLQLLIGSVDVPGGWRYKAPYPRPCPPGPRPAGRPEEIVPGKPLPGSPLGFPRGPEDLLLEADGRPVRIDKAFSWDAPLAVHGMLQTVIANAWRGDPYPVEVLFLYMANMAWNSAMNPGETMRMLADKDPATGAYRIPRFIYVDAYRSETVAYADLVLPDTTYLERWDCISLLDRPIGTAHGPGDAIRQPVVQPDRDVRPFQEVLIDLGVRLKLPAFAHPDGEPRYPGGYPDYLVHHQRKPGIGPLAGWRGAKGDEQGRGAPNDRQLEAYVANGCFWHFELAPEESYLKPVNRAYLARARELGLLDTAAPITLHLYAETLQRFRLAAAGARAGAAAGQPPRAHPHPLRPAAVLVPAVRAGGIRRRRLPAARDHPAADADVPQLGLAERLAAPDPGPQLPLHEPAHRRRAGARRRRLGRGHQPARPDPGPAAADGRLCREHGLDLERHRQAGRRLGPGAGCARGRARLPAQPRHRRAAARGQGLQPRQRRPDHRAGRVVRPARPGPQAGRAGEAQIEPRIPGDRAGRRHDGVRAGRARARSSSGWSSTSTPASAAMPAPPPASPGTTRAIPARWPTSTPTAPSRKAPGSTASTASRRARRAAAAPSTSPAPACTAPSPPASRSARPGLPTSASRTASCW